MKTHKRNTALFILVVSLLILGCGLEQQLGPTATSSPAPIYTPAPTDTPVPTDTSVPTDTPVPTETLAPTNTPEPTPTFKPTHTPKSTSTSKPTNTPKPTASSTPISPTPIPGWEKFEGGDVELWLPEVFVGGDLTNDLEVIVNNLRSLGSEFDQFADMIEQNPGMFVLLAIDPTLGANRFLTNVNVVKEQVISAITLDTYMDSAVDQFLSLGFTLIDRKIVQLDNYEAGTFVVQAETHGSKAVDYIIKVNNTMWVITYTTSIGEFEERLPMFEQSANTFKIQP